MNTSEPKGFLWLFGTLGAAVIGAYAVLVAADKAPWPSSRTDNQSPASERFNLGAAAAASKQPDAANATSGLDPNINITLIQRHDDDLSTPGKGEQAFLVLYGSYGSNRDEAVKYEKLNWGSNPRSNKFRIKLFIDKEHGEFWQSLAGPVSRIEADAVQKLAVQSGLVRPAIVKANGFVPADE